MTDKRSNMTEDDVMALARGLDAEVQPEHDLWPGIAAAIDEADSTATPGLRWPRMLAQAAAVVLLVGASSGVTWLTMQQQAPAPTPVAASGGFAFEQVSGSFGNDYTLGPDFQDARRMLVSRLEIELAELPPATRAEIERNIVTIRDAIAEINAALEQEPDNELLQRLLLKAYTEEIEVMQRVDSVTSSAMRRTDI